MTAVECHQSLNVDISDTVAVSDHEGSVSDQPFHASQAPASKGVQSGINQADLPVRSRGICSPHRTILQVQEKIAVVKMIVSKVFFDDLAFVSAGDQEVLVALAGIDAHDVPEHWLAADFDHWLRTKDRLLGEPGTRTSCKYHHLHGWTRFLTVQHRRLNQRALLVKS